MTYNEFPWLPLCGGLTLLGLILSWLVWRRRGAAAGLRMVAVSLIPLAAYLTKAVRMLWQIGSAIASFAANLLLSPQVWVGIGVTVLIVILFVVSGSLRRRQRGQVAGPAAPRAAGGPPPGKALKPAAAQPGRGKPATPGDDDFGEVADILRRRGIS
jgi:hypothetical protein